jgi:hypothetical protein
MKVEVKLIRSPLAKKKYRVIFQDGSKVDFGAKGYEDYTMHKDSKRKQNYLARHAKRENWSDHHTAGFWSRWLLWNKDNLTDSIIDIHKKFNIIILN